MELSTEQIEHMVNRFLGWKLPENFNPDGGIRFETMRNPYPAKNEPTGTNLFDADQAEAMVRYMADGLPECHVEAVSFFHQESEKHEYRECSVPAIGVGCGTCYERGIGLTLRSHPSHR